MSADGGARLLAYNGDDRHVIHLRVVQAGQQVDRARPRGGVAKPDLAGELGVGRGHEGRHLLVANLDVLEAVLDLLQRHVETADTVAGIAVDALDSPFLQALPHEVADVHAHGRQLRRNRTGTAAAGALVQDSKSMTQHAITRHTSGRSGVRR